MLPEEPFRYQWMDEFVAKMYQSEAKTAELVNLAMMITFVVSGMGLFGLAALAAGRRTKEIGIRKVLGARLVDISALVSREFVLLVGIALAIASPVAWYFLHDWLNNYENRVGIRWWVFGLAAVFAVGVAVVTAGFHAVRAALVNPVKSLRAE
jgi:putative ABC transport system permease protein